MIAVQRVDKSVAGEGFNDQADFTNECKKKLVSGQTKHISG
jgi:hypothetical protein